MIGAFVSTRMFSDLSVLRKKWSAYCAPIELIVLFVRFFFVTGIFYCRLLTILLSAWYVKGYIHIRLGYFIARFIIFALCFFMHTIISYAVLLTVASHTYLNDVYIHIHIEILVKKNFYPLNFICYCSVKT